MSHYHQTRTGSKIFFVFNLSTSFSYASYKELLSLKVLNIVLAKSVSDVYSTVDIRWTEERQEGGKRMAVA